MTDAAHRVIGRAAHASGLEVHEFLAALVRREVHWLEGGDPADYFGPLPRMVPIGSFAGDQLPSTRSTPPSMSGTR
jgi:hypothetical protein